MTLQQYHKIVFDTLKKGQYTILQGADTKISKSDIDTNQLVIDAAQYLLFKYNTTEYNIFDYVLIPNIDLDLSKIHNENFINDIEKFLDKLIN